jgi:uncharacterized protein with NAD-binding domain and iron-sulfur cluster
LGKAPPAPDAARRFGRFPPEAFVMPFRPLDQFPLDPGKYWVPGFSGDDHKLRRHRVAIFGAGVGGLTAAQELAERGFKVHVFDIQSQSQTGGLAASQWHLSSRARTAFLSTFCVDGPTITVPSEVPDKFWLPAEHGFRFFPSFYSHVIDTMKRIPVWDRHSLDVSKLSSFADEPNDAKYQKDLGDILDDMDKGAYGPQGTDNAKFVGLLKAMRAIQSLERFRGYVDFFRPAFVAGSNLVTTNKVALVFDDGRVFEYDRRKPRSQLGSFVGSFLFELFGLGFNTRDMALLATRMLQYLTSCRERRIAEYEKTTFWEFMRAKDVSPTLQMQLGRFTRLLMAMDAQHGETRTILNVLVRMLLDQNADGTSTDRVLNGPTSERWIVPWVRHLQQNLGVSFHWCVELKKLHVEHGQVVNAWLFDRKTMVEGDELLSLDGYLAQPASNGQSEAEEVSYIDPGVPTYTGAPPTNQAPLQQWNYFVTDLPVGALWKVLTSNAPTPTASEDILAMDEAETSQLPPRNFPAHNPDPPLRSIGELTGPESNPMMSGIQFYLSDPMDLGVPGHLNFIDSKWALTAIVQSQFWGPDFVTRYGSYICRAVLSVDIAEFDVPGETVPQTLKQLVDASRSAPTGSPLKKQISDTIAKEVWHQIAKGLQKWEVRLPEPLETPVTISVTFQDPNGDDPNGDDPNGDTVTITDDYPIPLPYLDHHIDWGLCFCNDKCSNPDPDNTPDDKDECGHPVEGDLGYFIATPNSWRHRPGPLPIFDECENGYRVRLGSKPHEAVPRGLLVAGIYAQTFTSLNTMEAANESARHAVNGLIAHYQHWRAANDIAGGRNRYETCRIWPLEELEPADFEWGKQVDSRLFSLGDPHAVEIQGVDKMVDYFFKVFNVENVPQNPEQLQQKFKEALWLLTSFGRYDPY